MDAAEALRGAIITLVLVLANGFFVASEYSFVRVRSTQLDELAKAGSARAKLAARGADPRVASGADISPRRICTRVRRHHLSTHRHRRARAQIPGHPALRPARAALRISLRSLLPA